jgi:DNA primase
MRKGRATVGLCPFHSEKTPSFNVREDKGFFNCFGCGEKGDAITFIMKRRTLNYADAVTYICEQYNIELKYDSKDTPQKPVKDMKALHEMFAERAKISLFKPEGIAALEYLKSRGFEENIIKRFDLGWAPPDISITPFENSFTGAVIAGSGIFSKYRKCLFANRILFPIHSATGACIGFSGRTMDPAERSKYINSPETSLFSKRHELYNLHNAKEIMKKDKSCFIVEGYFDAIRMVAAGFPQTVAIMGTAFTKEQVAQLKRYSAEEYNLILDGDEAGIKAMMKSRDIAIECDIYPNVIFLPAGEDPDTFLKNNGKEGFDKILETRQDLLIHTIKNERGKGTDNNKRFNRLNDIKSILEKIKNPYRQEYYLKETASLFEVSEQTLSDDVSSGKPKNAVIRYAKKTGNINFMVEKDFITYLFLLPEDMTEHLTADLPQECFDDETFRLIYKKILEFFAQGDNIIELRNDTEVGETIADMLINKKDTPDCYSAAIDCKTKLMINFCDKERYKIADQITSTGESGNLEAYMEYLRNINKHQKKTYTGED